MRQALGYALLGGLFVFGMVDNENVPRTFVRLVNGPHCMIVTDGSRRVLDHEKAHCAGWDHPPFEPADPPPEYIDAYKGPMTVVRCGRRYECKSVQELCKRLWAENGSDMSAFETMPGYSTFDGCSIKI